MPSTPPAWTPLDVARRQATLDDVFLAITSPPTAPPKEPPHDRRTRKPRPPEVRSRWLLSDTLVFTRRNLAHIRQIPEKLLDVTVQPLMFVLLFAYVFGGAIGVPGGNYREYLIGGILVQSLAFGLVGPANSIATDLNEGVIDRFRSLPTSRSRVSARSLLRRGDRHDRLRSPSCAALV